MCMCERRPALFSCIHFLIDCKIYSYSYQHPTSTDTWSVQSVKKVKWLAILTGTDDAQVCRARP